ncbi:hypothetical protein SAMN05216362_10299 [Piscibacillus halophilus]|uniref:Uncharacterized protein n=1 Tax=Piscibacillus halophilus TaxID=571933 RepID=A0A1H8ZXE2_9BACI|nr:hypothetical protein SAMN05216362_10299 [Piscibacillus halophilus]
MEEQLTKNDEQVDVLNLPPRRKIHRKKQGPKRKKEFNSVKVSQIILKALLILFIILIIFIPIAAVYWLQ